jgi:hypothetical protein
MSSGEKLTEIVSHVVHHLVVIVAITGNLVNSRVEILELPLKHLTGNGKGRSNACIWNIVGRINTFFESTLVFTAIQPPTAPRLHHQWIIVCDVIWNVTKINQYLTRKA